MKKTILAAIVALFGTSPAMAQDYVEMMLLQLEEQGYILLEMDETWLGRIRILAQSTTAKRELVFVPTTGEVLRDYTIALETVAAPNTALTSNEKRRKKPVVVAEGDPLLPPVVVRDLPSPTDGTGVAASPPVSVTLDPTSPTPSN